jgi:hypothetical protein
LLVFFVCAVNAAAAASRFRQGKPSLLPPSLVGVCVQQVIAFLFFFRCIFCAAMSRASSTTVLVSGLPPNSTEDLLLPYFLQFGNVICIRFKYNRETGACLGYGFVTYSSADEAAAAVVKRTEGREFRVAPAENGK